MRPVIKYGLITGISVSLWLLLSFAVVKSFNIPADKSRALSGLLSIVVLTIGVYLGIKKVRKNNNGVLLYKNAAFTGIKISLITAVIVSLYSLLYCTVINPDFTDFMVKEAEKALISSGATPQEIAIKSEAIKKEYSISMLVMQGFIGQTVMGSIASLIIGIFMKTKPINP
jgi:hypothetical protein